MMDRDTWNSLSHFRTFDLVQRQFVLRHERELSSERTWEIISCFIQAHEYFSSAEAAAETVRPVLLYYGVLSISRGIILFLDGSTREATLSAKHGLRTGAWEQVLSRGIGKVLQLDVKIENGTYTELARATENRFVAPTPLEGGMFEIAGLRPPLGESSLKTINLSDVLSRVPRLRKVYGEVTQEKPRVFLGVIIGSIDAQIIRIARDPMVGLTTAEEVRAIFHVPDDIEIGGWGGDPMMFPFPNFAYRLPHNVSSTGLSGRPALEEFGDKYGSLIVPWPNGGYVSPLLRCFLASYFLGMLVRYYPSRWMAFIRNEKGDAVLPLLRETIDYVEQDYPRLALEALKSKL